MVKLTKNVHEMVQNRPKSSFVREGFASFRGVHTLILEFREVIDCCCKLKGGCMSFQEFLGVVRVLRLSAT